MKKVLSVLTAVCIMLMTGITAFAAQPPSADKVMAQINGAAAYLMQGVEGYGVDSAMDFSLLADSGADVSKYADGFVADVKANLDLNNGKIVSAYGENLATYGAVITALTALGENTADFYGYNIQTAFMAMDPKAVPVTPNYYLTIINGAFWCNDSDAFLEALCDTYISEFYTKGKGVDYYGYSCDNTAYFAAAISYGYYQLGKYSDVLNDAIAVVEGYCVDGGYCFNPEYGTEPNANSTALALLAYSSYYGEISTDTDLSDLGGNFAKLNAIYNNLCTFEGEKTGVFTYDGEESAYSTKDALAALSSYYWDAAVQECPDKPSTEKPTVPPTTEAPKTPAKEEQPTKPQTTAKTDTAKKSPNTGADIIAVSAATAFLTAAGVYAVLKKREK